MVHEIFTVADNITILWDIYISQLIASEGIIYIISF